MPCSSNALRRRCATSRSAGGCCSWTPACATSSRRGGGTSAPELDLVVAAARRAGAHGARLTGAGWGGAVIVLLGKGEGGRGKGERQIAEAVTRTFLRAYGREPAITPVRPSGGVRREAIS